MKKLLPMALALLLLLSACGTTADEGSPIYNVKNGTFSCSAQELIDNINNATKGSDEFPQISEWTGSTDDIEIDGPDLTMTLMEEDGKLYSVIVYWKATNSNSTILIKAGALEAMLFALLVPEPDPIHEEISAAISDGYGDIDVTNGDVEVHFDTGRLSGVNNLYIQVAK